MTDHIAPPEPGMPFRLPLRVRPVEHNPMGERSVYIEDANRFAVCWVMNRHDRGGLEQAEYIVRAVNAHADRNGLP